MNKVCNAFEQRRLMEHPIITQSTLVTASFSLDKVLSLDLSSDIPFGNWLVSARKATTERKL